MGSILRRIPFNKIKNGALRAGLPLVCIGAMVISVCVLSGTSNNAILIMSVLFIITGTCLHVISLKKESGY